MRRYGQAWQGPVTGIAREKTAAFPFAQQVRPEDEPFSFSLLPPGRRIGPEDIRGHDLVLCSADNYEYLHVADICAGLGVRLSSSSSTSSRRGCRSCVWKAAACRHAARDDLASCQERRRRRAFAMADGLQANG